MATAWVTELEDISRPQPTSEAHSDVPVAKMPPVTVQKITFTTSTASNAFNARTRFVRVFTDNAGAIAFLNFGTTPVATTSTTPIEDRATEYFGVIPGHKVAFYNGSA